MMSLESLTLQNFLSYGDYETKILLSNRQQCFITGEIVDSEDETKSSNGAGKSSLMQAILWCLTGRTMHTPKPGNKILNHFTNGTCRVKLKFTTGEELIRTREKSTTDQLMFTRGEQTIIDTTLSTTPNMQKLVDRELNLDWDVFCGSVFCSQYNKPWLEMPDTTRKAAFERITGIDRLSTYAQIAKGKKDKVEKHQERHNIEIKALEEAIEEYQETIETIKSKSEAFEEQKLQKIQKKHEEADEQDRLAETIRQIDIEALEKKWNIVKQINDKIKKLRKDQKDIEKKINKQTQKYESESDNLSERLDKTEDDLNDEIRQLEKSNREQLSELTDNRDSIREELSDLKGELKPIDILIKKWQSKKGTICTECEQEIHEDHAEDKIDELLKIADSLRSQINELEQNLSNNNTEIEEFKESSELIVNELREHKTKELSKIKELIKQARENHEKVIDDLNDDKNNIENTINTTESKIESYKPKVTIKEAKATNQQRSGFSKLAKRLRKEAEEIKEEENPHDGMIENTEINLKNKTRERDRLKKKIDNFSLVHNHINYIYRSYSDRRKIKSYLISRHIPFFNTRLHHYLDSFALDIKIELTESLTVKSDKWGYDYLSGGERKRCDVAFMLAVMDLHSAIHGKQCNILVLDEVDSRLDEAGIDSLIDIIKNDLSSKFDSTFIISHRKMMKDVFPHSILVRRIDRFSLAVDSGLYIST